MQLIPPEQLAVDIRTSQKVIETCTSENDNQGPNQQELSDSNSDDDNSHQLQI